MKASEFMNTLKNLIKYYFLLILCEVIVKYTILVRFLNLKVNLKIPMLYLTREFKYVTVKVKIYVNMCFSCASGTREKKNSAGRTVYEIFMKT